MTPPPSEWEHLQSVLMRVQNKRVREGFRIDIPDDDITTPEGSLRHACTLKDTDTAAMTQLRLELFYTIREENSRSLPDIWAVPDFTPDVYNELKPQVIISWAEKTDDWKARGAKRRKTMRTSFRLMDETSATLTESNIRQLRDKIAITFPRTYKFKTGRYKVSYMDKPKGYSLIIAPHQLPKGDTFIKDILSIRGDTFEDDKRSQNNRTGTNYRTPRYVQTVEGRLELPERRQIAEVYLDKVELNVYGLQKNLMLIDRMISHPRFGINSQYLT
ncbi:MAG: hypothetical protein ACFB0D_02050 [Phormidesmis sp.]